MPESLVDDWKDGRTLFGVWCTMPGSVQAEFIAWQQPDYVCVDLQHGLIDHSTGIPMVQAITAGGSRPIVRVPWNEPAPIMRALDCGALGVVVPMVDDAEQAERAVRACRYPPRGMRSYGPVRARQVHGSADPEVLEQVACIVMVETAGGIQNVREIAKVEGVDAIYVGPSDLALAMGMKPGQTTPDSGFDETIDAIRDACRESGIAAGIQAPDGPTAARYRDRGFDMITIGSDAPLMSAAIRSHLGVARGDVGASTSISNY